MPYIAPPSDEIDDDASQKKAQIQIGRRPTPPGRGTPSKIISAISISPITAPTMGVPTLNQSSGIDEGGAFWKSYNKMFRDQMVTNQNEDSPWPNPQGNKH